MKTLITRSITGLLFAGTLLGASWAGPYAYLPLFFLIAMLCLNEFYNLLIRAGHEVQKRTGLILSGTGLLLILVVFMPGMLIELHDFSVAMFSVVFLMFLIIVPLFSIIPFIIEIVRNKENQMPFRSIANTLFGIIYTVPPFILLPILPMLYTFHSEQAVTIESEFLMAWFLMVWINDTGAYLVGMPLGRHRLLERISPKKSLEGAIGGLLFALGLAWLFSLYLTALPLGLWLGLAAVVVVFGNLGDLAESQFKRSIGVKDSGKLLPGHGGLLDRFDAMLLSAPASFVYLVFTFLVLK